MHLLMPWFLPLAGLSLWFGVHTVHDMPHESHRHKRQAMQLLCIAVIPLLVWLIAQFIESNPGVAP